MGSEMCIRDSFMYDYYQINDRNRQHSERQRRVIIRSTDSPCSFHCSWIDRTIKITYQSTMSSLWSRTGHDQSTGSPSHKRNIGSNHTHLEKINRGVCISFTNRVTYHAHTIEGRLSCMLGDRLLYIVIISLSFSQALESCIGVQIVRHPSIEPAPAKLIGDFPEFRIIARWTCLLYTSPSPRDS